MPSWLGGATPDAGAIATIEAAAQRGEPDALAQLARWRLTGDGLPRDLVEARRWLRAAAAAGDEWATLAEIALVANGSGAPADWPRALSLLRAAALRFEEAAHHLALISAMDLDDHGRPPARAPTEVLGEAPRVIRARALLTPAECAHLARTAQDLLEPSTVYDPGSDRKIAHPIRTSAAATLGPTRESLPVRAIAQRIATLIGMPDAHGEAFSILHYAPGQQYRMHHDALPGAAGDPRVNQRVGTVIVFLNEGYEGGETLFEANGLRVRGRIGDAIAFGNLRPDGSPDPLSRHAGAAVTQGAKWVATRWIRARPWSAWEGG